MSKNKSNVTPLTEAKKEAAEDAELVSSEGETEQPVDAEKSVTVTHSELSELLRVAQLGGASKAAHAMENANKVLSLKAIHEIKDSKAYKLIPYQENGKSYNCCTFRVYCEKVLGRSYSSVNNDLKSLGKFGPRLLEIMYDAGIGEREKARMRNMPDEVIESLSDKIINLADVKDPATASAIHNEVERKIRERLEPVQEELDEEKKNAYRLGKALDRKELEEKIEKDKAAKRQAPPWPELVLRIREESAAAAMIAVGSLDDIERLMSDLAAGGDALVGAKNGKADYDAAASAIGLNLSMIVSRVSQVMSLAHSMGLSDYLDDQDQNVTLLTDTEAESVRTRWQVMLNDAADAQKHRVAARNGKVSRGRRGRPKGSKNKSKDA